MVGYKHTWILGKQYSVNVSYKIFCGWDFSIQDRASATLKRSFIRNDLKVNGCTCSHWVHDSTLVIYHGQGSNAGKLQRIRSHPNALLGRICFFNQLNLSFSFNFSCSFINKVPFYGVPSRLFALIYEVQCPGFSVFLLVRLQIATDWTPHVSRSPVIETWNAKWMQKPLVTASV